jgi:hypothetical protein
MSKWIHRISNVDSLTKTGDCSNCGRVRVRLYRDKKRCTLAINEYKKRTRPIPKYRWGGSEKYLRNKLRPPLGTPCAICTGRMSVLCWDHDHDTGEFRGWICSKCNTMLGFAKDNVKTLNNAIKYLQKTPD